MKPTRRDLFTLGGGTLAGLAFTPVPWRLLDDSAKWTQNWSWIPRPPRGEVSTRYTACSLCQQGCGLKVRCCGGQPFGVAPVAQDPNSKGTLCPVAFGAHQLPFHPSRIRTALYDGSPLPTKEAIAGVQQLLKEADQKGAVVAVLDPRPGRTTSKLYRNFAASLRHGMYVAEPQSSSGVDYEGARMILSVGARILEGSPRVMQAWARRGESGALFVHADSSFTKTAALADRWIPLQPESEAAFLNALRVVLTTGDGGDEALRATGLPVAVIHALAADFGTRTPSVIVTSRTDLNDVIASIHGALGSRSALVVRRRAPVDEEDEAATPLAAIADKSVQLAFVESSQIEAVTPKMARNGAIVALSAYATRARYTIPIPAFLESLEEIGTPPDAITGTWGLAPPVSSAPDGVLSPESLIAQITEAASSTREEALRERAAKIHASGRGSCFSFHDGTTTRVTDIPSPEDFWKKLQDGALWVDDRAGVEPATFATHAFRSAGPDIAPPLSTKLYRESKLGRA